MSETKITKISYEDLLMSNVFMLQALINLLEKKGLISKEELLQEMAEVKDEYPKGIQ